MEERAEVSGTAFWGDVDDAEALRRYRMLVNAIGDGVYQLDAESRFVAVDDGIVELTGYAREELLGEHVSLLFDDDGSTTERPPSTPAEQSERLEFPVRTAEGDRVRCEVRVTRLEADGTGQGTVGVVRDITDRRRPDRSLGESDRQRDREPTSECEPTSETRTRLEVAASAGSVSTWTWNVRENVATADEGLAELYGVAPEEAAAGVPIEEFFASVREADRERVSKRLDEAVEETGEFEAEYRVANADGETRWVVSRGEVEYADDGEARRMNGTTSDITRRKEAEAELERVTAEAEEQERLYETIISSTPDLVYAFDLDYRFTFANDAVLEMWGQTREESVGKTLREIGYEPWHAEMHEREIDEVIETKEPVRGEVAFPHVERGRRIYDYIFAPVLDDDGEVEAIAGTTRDVTERKRAEEALKESEERFRALVTASSDVVYRVSADWSEMHELEGKEFLADTDRATSDWVDKYIHPDDRERVEEAIDEAIRTKSIFELEHRVERDDGKTGWTFSRAVPMLDEDGEIDEWIGMASDITERKRRERELEERTERLNQFASMLAHELRNPVTIGQIYSQQLPDDADSEAVGYVAEAFDRIEDMIDVMLVLTRGREAVGERTPVELADAAWDAWDDVDAPEATLDVELDRTIQADETYVRHLFRNLLENAVEHGGSDVTITVGDLSTGFYVEDDGTGIPEEDRDAVFQAGYTTAAEQKGIGLGLAFVRELADVYDWTCAVAESAAGGARLEFTNTDRDPRRT